MVSVTHTKGKILAVTDSSITMEVNTTTGRTARIFDRILFDHIESILPGMTLDCTLILQPGSSELQINKENQSKMTSTHKEAALLKAANELLVANNTLTTLELKLKLRKDAPEYYWDQTIVSSMMASFAQQNKFTYVDAGTYRVYSGTTTPAPKKGRGRPRKTTLVNPTPAPAVIASPAPAVTPVVQAKRGRGRPRKTTTIVMGPQATQALATSAPVTVQVKRAQKTISKTDAAEMIINSNHGQAFTATFVKKNGQNRQINCQYMKDQAPSKLGYIKVKEMNKLRAGVQPIRTVDLRTLLSYSMGQVDYKIRG